MGHTVIGNHGVMRTLRVWMVFAAVLSLPVAVAAANTEVRLYIVTDYRYVPEKGKRSDPILGQSLCGTRCNAIATDYLNVVEPGGWRLIKVAANRELTVPLNNPFVGGQCVCITDEFVVRVDHLNRP